MQTVMNTSRPAMNVHLNLLTMIRLSARSARAIAGEKCAAPEGYPQTSKNDMPFPRRNENHAVSGESGSLDISFSQWWRRLRSTART